MKPLFQTITKLWVFVLGDLRRDAQSLFGFGLKYLWIFFSCFIYGAFFKAALPQKYIPLNGHLIDYPLFLVSGLVVARVIPFSIRIFEATLSKLKNSGLIEWVLVTPSSLWELFASTALWNGFCFVTEFIAIVGFSRLCIGTPIRPFLQSALIQPIFFMFAATAGIGMIISGLSLFLRRGNFLFTAFFQVSAALGGVFFPTEIFTGKLKFISVVSQILPITHALKAVRLSLMHKEVSNSAAHGWPLVAMTLILTLMGFILLQTGLIWAKKNAKFSKELYN